MPIFDLLLFDLKYLLGKNMVDQSATKSLSFPQAIAATQSLMEKMNANQLSETEIRQEISAILSTKNGGRGFFVSYLTSDLPLADSPSPGAIEGLKSSPKVTTELLVKNLAMSSAMAVVHTRNNDSENLEGSQKVYRRTGKLIQLIELEKIGEELRKLHQTINTGNGEYTDFLKRWNYDSQQQQAIQKAIANIIHQ
jgi:hypothetical protein